MGEQPLPFEIHARMGDPRSSEDTVRSIAKDRTLAGLILDAADYLMPYGFNCFDDTDLLERIEEVTGRRHQRNVIARARGLLEPSGQIVRIGPISRPDRRVDTIHFTTGATQ